MVKGVKSVARRLNGVTWRWVAIGAVGLVAFICAYIVIPAAAAWANRITIQVSAIPIHDTRLNNQEASIKDLKDGQKDILKEIKELREELRNGR